VLYYKEKICKLGKRNKNKENKKGRKKGGEFFFKNKSPRGTFNVENTLAGFYFIFKNGE